jgi:hypothetical protein
VAARRNTSVPSERCSYKPSVRRTCQWSISRWRGLAGGAGRQEQRRREYDAS